MRVVKAVVGQFKYFVIMSQGGRQNPIRSWIHGASNALSSSILLFAIAAVTVLVTCLVSAAIAQVSTTKKAIGFLPLPHPERV